ncbi:MAG: hypothetical protein RLZZ01_1268 [Actinomycetota bacterium]
MDGPVVAPRFAEFPRAVQRIDDPDPVGREPARVLSAFLVEYGVARTKPAEFVADEPVAGRVTCIHDLPRTGPLGPEPLTEFDEEVACFAGETDGEFAVGLDGGLFVGSFGAGHAGPV